MQNQGWLTSRWACVFLLLGSMLVFPAISMADTAMITVVDPSGNPEPGEDLANTYTVSGTATAARSLYVKFRTSGGAPCAPTASADSGSNNFRTFHLPYGSAINGPFSFQSAGVWLAGSGTFTFCVWSATTDFTIGTVFSQNVTFRPPRGSIALKVSSPNPYPGQIIILSFVGSSEAPRYIYAKLRATGGAPCAPTFDADSGNSLLSSSLVNGAFNVPLTPTSYTRGRAQVCMWLASSSNDLASIGGPQTAFFEVRSLATALTANLTSLRGRRVRVAGRVTSQFGIPAGACLLQRRAGSGWKIVGSSTVRADGACAFIRRLGIAGRFQFRVVFRPGAPQWGPSRVPAKTLRIRR